MKVRNKLRLKPETCDKRTKFKRKLTRVKIYAFNSLEKLILFRLFCSTEAAKEYTKFFKNTQRFICYRKHVNLEQDENFPN